MSTSHPVFSPNGVALITGGASGIGLAFAHLCHQNHHMRIALIDISSSALNTAVETLLSTSTTSSPQPPTDPATTSDTALVPAPIQAYTHDVSQPNSWADLKARVEMDFGLPTLLFLGAGIAAPSAFDDAAPFEKIMQTNYMGIVHGITTFLPSLRRQDPTPTAVVVVGSKQGITNPPGNPAYNASKAAVRSLAESLSFDLRSTSTDVFLLVPGWTWTGIAGKKEGIEKPPGPWTPEQVVEYLEEAMAEGGERGFYAIAPDNDVSEALDKRRMLWGTDDLVERRPPLSRWREGWKEESKNWIEGEGGGMSGD